MEIFNTDLRNTSVGFGATAQHYRRDSELHDMSGALDRRVSVGGAQDQHPVPAENWISGCEGAAHGRPVMEPEECGPCPVKPPKCDCHVIGGNTLGTTGLPTGASAAARFGRVQLDSGDARIFVPYYIYVTAFQVDTDVTISGLPALVLLTDSKSGQEANLRRASSNNPSLGVSTLIYGEDKEIECVDWNRFSSTNNQQLNLTFFNPQDFAVHIFVALWGIPAA